MRIAIVGSGIAGLTAAYLLQRNHDITVFEAEDRAGGHTHTVNVRLNEQNYAVDTGFIVFNNWTLPEFHCPDGPSGRDLTPHRDELFGT